MEESCREEALFGFVGDTAELSLLTDFVGDPAELPLSVPNVLPCALHTHVLRCDSPAGEGEGTQGRGSRGLRRRCSVWMGEAIV